jgi:hypothetical protein
MMCFVNFIRYYCFPVLWIRISIEFDRLDPYPGVQKWPTKIGKSEEISCIHVLDVLFFGLMANKSLNNNNKPKKQALNSMSSHCPFRRKKSRDTVPFKTVCTFP